MLRAIKLVVLSIVLLLIILVSLANREPVTLALMPPGLDTLFQWSVTMPLFLLLVGAVLAGILLGYVLEWLREWRHRRAAARRAREAKRLQAEVEKLKREKAKDEDDVLALLR